MTIAQLFVTLTRSELEKNGGIDARSHGAAAPAGDGGSGLVTEVGFDAGENSHSSKSNRTLVSDQDMDGQAQKGQTASAVKFKD